ncbi:hypothetical protein LUZ63_019711 [Rhynchospora breviuscula]|uniref:RING-type domain-containing protein n=1 Tax=Rhynchospora breviuscula TaxID=2022672 RepID=A0A9Q0C6S3_9POAL|nr:hypothetical protein LUZ63_019711 [Rhynchospora breviuscula]
MSSVIAPSPSELHSNGAFHPIVLIYTSIVIVLVVVIICLLFVSWKCGNGSVWDDGAFDYSAPANRSHCSSPREKSVQTKDLSFLPEFVHVATDGGEKNECAVCITEFVDGQIGWLLPVCGHKCHKECVAEWFRKHSTCPICRTIVE